MKTLTLLFTVMSTAWLFTGCTTNYGVGSPYHPGPVAGKAIGATAGVIAGNAAGFGVGISEGAAHGLAAPFNPNYQLVRYWRTETTADGRTVQVPYDVLVDKYGRPVNMPAPTGNPAPPASSGPAGNLLYTQ